MYKFGQGYSCQCKDLNGCITINVELSFSPKGIVCRPGYKEREPLGNVCIRKYYLLTFKKFMIEKCIFTYIST